MPNPDGSETPAEKQARVENELADKLARNKAAADNAEQPKPKHAGKQGAANTRHHSAPRHGDQSKKTGRRQKKP